MRSRAGGKVSTLPSGYPTAASVLKQSAPVSDTEEGPCLRASLQSRDGGAMHTARLMIWTVASTLFVSAVAAGQSLGELARREEERRKAIEKPARLYTIEDVRRLAGGEIQPPQAAGGASAEAASLQTPPPAPVAPAEAKDAAPPVAMPATRDEAYWRGLMSDLRMKLSEASQARAELTSRAQALTGEVAAATDLSQRAALSRELSKILAEIERLDAEIAKRTREIAGLENQARREGVPAGWIREP